MAGIKKSVKANEKKENKEPEKKTPPNKKTTRKSTAKVKKKATIKNNVNDNAPSVGGRPIKEVDYTELKKLCEIQCTGEECAGFLDMDYDTLNNRIMVDKGVGFTEYFTQNSQGGKVSLRRKQFQAAKEGNPTMLIWLGKQWLGQAEKQKLELDSKRPIVFHIDEQDKNV